MATPKTQTTAVNTVEDRPVPLEMAYQHHEQKRRELVKHYRDEQKFPVSVSPFYAPYLGNNVPISIQGILVYVPADGKTYKIPETFAAELIQAMAKIDERQRKMQKLSNVTSNVEHSIGEIKF